MDFKTYIVLEALNIESCEDNHEDTHAILTINPLLDFLISFIIYLDN